MHLIIYSASAQQVLDILSLTAHQQLCAYIDPGTGSFIIQIVIAAFVGCSLAIKIYWNKIKTYIRNLIRMNGKTPEK
jgi:hypothetical protein